MYFQMPHKQMVGYMDITLIVLISRQLLSVWMETNAAWRADLEVPVPFSLLVRMVEPWLTWHQVSLKGYNSC